MGESRREYLDWLRGIAVLIMIEGHTIDAWTRPPDRNGPTFNYGMILAGIGAPIFLFLGGITIVLAAGGRVRNGLSPEQAAAAARWRGWQIFGLAFLFRLQSLVLSAGEPISLLKIDILNIMGLAIVGAAVLWGWSRRDLTRAALLGGAAVALSMLTPVVRTTASLAALPDPIEWYLRPDPVWTTFTLFPWAGFLFAGAALGVWLQSASTPAAERRIVLALAAGGPAVAAASYGASFLPPMYAQASFWTSSPTFFFLRVGILMALVPVAYVASLNVRALSAPLEYFGRASLFVYWIHVEMVYGVMSAAIHRRLSLPQWSVAFVAFTVLLFGLAGAKNWIGQRYWPRRP